MSGAVELHSPGDWSVSHRSNDTQIFVRSNKCGLVASIPIPREGVLNLSQAEHSARARANASLIVASPALLAACKAVAKWASDTGAMEAGAADEQTWQMVVAAIARAGGAA